MSFDHSGQAEKRIHWQYRNGQQLRQWIDTLPSIAQGGIEGTSLSIRNVLDIENANTWQLNIIGAIVGQSRNTQELMDDEIYRAVIRSRIAKNNSYATVDGIKDAVEFVTQDQVLEVVDGLDMSFSIVFDDPLEPLVRDLLLTVDIVPRPQGVRFTGFIEPEVLPKFGVDGLGSEEPAPDVEGLGELQSAVIEDEEGFVMDLGDGVLTGLSGPTVGDYGGHLAELYEVV